MRRVIRTRGGGDIIQFDRAALTRVAPIGASLVLHLGLVAVAAGVVPHASARVPDAIAVDLVVIEAPRVVEAPPAAPAPPKRLTLPRPIAAPPPKIDTAPKADEPASVAPPRPAGAPPPAASPTVAPAPNAQASAPAVSLPTTAPAPAGRATEGGVSMVENATKSAPPAVASIPRDSGVTQVARPTGGYQVRPSYPSSAKRLGVQGTTLLRVHVLEDGRVGNVEIEQSAGHPDLDEAASDAVRRWRFDPARRGEQAVAMWVRLPVEFRLK